MWTKVLCYGIGFFLVQLWIYSRIAFVDKQWWRGASPRSVRSRIARGGCCPYYNGVSRCIVAGVVSLVGTKVGEWCVLGTLIALGFWRKYCRYDEGMRLFVK